MDPRPLILIDTGIIGGPGRGILQLAKFCVTHGVDYLICTFAYGISKTSEFRDELGRQKLHATTISQRAFWDPSPLWQFLHVAKRGRYNIIQSHGYKSHFVALIVSRVLGVPWVAFAHGWTREDRKVMVYHYLDTWMLRYAECVIAVSPPLKKLFSSLRGARRPTELILNAVDRDDLSGREGGSIVRKRFVKRADRFLIGCFGRLSFEKGQDLLLRSMENVTKRISTVSVLLLGDGPELESLRRLTAELGLTERVRFHPYSSAMRDYYEAVDLLVLPSRSEGLPNVILEAQSFGVPVIATDVGAVGEAIVDGETGWLVPPEDVDALSRGIERALSDERVRANVSQAAMRSVLKKFSPTARGQDILHVYRFLLERQ